LFVDGLDELDGDPPLLATSNTQLHHQPRPAFGDTM
jgi:hypothetical protein